MSRRMEEFKLFSDNLSACLMRRRKVIEEQAAQQLARREAMRRGEDRRRVERILDSHLRREAANHTNAFSERNVVCDSIDRKQVAVLLSQHLQKQINKAKNQVPAIDRAQVAEMLNKHLQSRLHPQKMSASGEVDVSRTDKNKVVEMLSKHLRTKIQVARDQQADKEAKDKSREQVKQFLEKMLQRKLNTSQETSRSRSTKAAPVQRQRAQTTKMPKSTITNKSKPELTSRVPGDFLAMDARKRKQVEDVLERFLAARLARMQSRPRTSACKTGRPQQAPRAPPSPPDLGVLGPFPLEESVAYELQHQWTPQASLYLRPGLKQRWTKTRVAGLGAAQRQVSSTLQDRSQQLATSFSSGPATSFSSGPALTSRVPGDFVAMDARKRKQVEDVLERFLAARLARMQSRPRTSACKTGRPQQARTAARSLPARRSRSKSFDAACPPKGVGSEGVLDIKLPACKPQTQPPVPAGVASQSLPDSRQQLLAELRHGIQLRRTNGAATPQPPTAFAPGRTDNDGRRGRLPAQIRAELLSQIRAGPPVLRSSARLDARRTLPREVREQIQFGVPLRATGCLAVHPRLPLQLQEALASGVELRRTGSLLLHPRLPLPLQQQIQAGLLAIPAEFEAACSPEEEEVIMVEAEAEENANWVHGWIIDGDYGAEEEGEELEDGVLCFE